MALSIGECSYVVHVTECYLVILFVEGVHIREVITQAKQVGLLMLPFKCDASSSQGYLNTPPPPNPGSSTATLRGE